MYLAWDPNYESAAQPDDGPKHDDGHGEGQHDEHGPHDGGGRLD